MAFLIKSPRTKFWVLRFRDLDTGRWRERSTKCPHDDPKETRRAQRMADLASRQEAQIAPTDLGDFAAWVSDHLATRYADSPRSLKRYTWAWDRVAEWLRARNLRHPAAIRYAHAADYMAWRTGAEGGSASHNTARLELKFFSTLMREAMRRELTAQNPIALASVPKERPAEKKDLGPDDFTAARAAFAARTKAPWMLTVFEICAHLGCRFNEAEFGPEAVDFDNLTVTLTDSKRKPNDPRKRFTVPLPPTLADHLRAVFEKRTRTAPNLAASNEHNRQFNRTLRAACGATSHSLRVSFVTRCHRAGLSESQAMRLVNHTTRLVHAVYSKLSIEDARTAAARVLPPV